MKAAAYAPAFGMIGTLVGLINMLKGMDLGGGGGASSLGQDMSVALITTFYGSALANIFAQPIAKKLRVRQAAEEYNNRGRGNGNPGRRESTVFTRASDFLYETVSKEETPAESG